MVKSSTKTTSRPVIVIAGQAAIVVQVFVLALMAWLLAFGDQPAHAGTEVVLTGHIAVAVVLAALSIGLVRRSNAARTAIILLEAIVITVQVFLLLGGASSVGYVDVLLSIAVLACLGVDESRDWFKDE